MKTAHSTAVSLPRAVGVFCAAACLSLYGAFTLASALHSDASVIVPARAVPARAGEEAALGAGAAGQEFSRTGGLVLGRGEKTTVSGVPRLRVYPAGGAGVLGDAGCTALPAVFSVLLLALYFLYIRLSGLVSALRRPVPRLLC